MKDLLRTLFERLKETSAQTRLVVGAGAALILVIGVASVWRARNPHLVHFRSGLDNDSLSAVTSALSRAGVRFDTTRGEAPHTIWVEEARFFEANNAVATEGAFSTGARGIDPEAGSSAFDASVERMQKANKRYWQEIEQQLEEIAWVRRAKVVARYSERPMLGRREEPSVSVTLHVTVPRVDPEQAQAVASMVQKSFNTSADNVSIVDQRGLAIYDGGKEQGLDEALAFERAQNRERTLRAQELLDRSFGPGLAQVSVASEWDWTRTEEVNESHGPKGTVISEVTSESSTPGMTSVAGGPAGVEQNLNPAQAGSSAGEAPLSTRNETEKRYSLGNKVTHVIQNQPLLQRLSVSLVLDKSLEEQLADASSFVKSAVGFDEARDTFSGTATTLHGLERDEEGNPVLPVAEELPERPSSVLTLLFDHGVEIVSAIFFLLLLGRTLRRSDPASSKPGRRAGAAGDPGAAGAMAGVTAEAQEVDPNLVARMHVEELLDAEPERVGALLSRWALGEDYYTAQKS